MRQQILKKLFGKDVSTEGRSFYLGILFFFMTMAFVLIDSAINGLPAVFFIVTAICILSVTAAFGFAIRTGRYNICAFATSLIIIMIELPLAYRVDGRLVSGILLYYVLGFFFIVFNVYGIFRIVAIAGFVGSFLLSLIGMYMLHSADGMPVLLQINIVEDIIIPLLICAFYIGFSLEYQLQAYEKELTNAEEEKSRSEQIEQSKDVFLMNMSHEMRTPMNAIMNSAGLIAQKNVNPEVRRHVSYIRNACQTLISTIDDLLVFSEVKGNEMEFIGEAYDLPELLEEIINMISIRVMNSDLSFYVHIDPILPKTLFGDSGKLRQLFINILNNAIKYTMAGYVELNVKARVLRADEVILEAKVKDTGIGIREEQIPKLFDAFERADDRLHDSIRIEGTGLGLAISKSIAEGMGGKIEVESEYNKGSVFTFEVRQQVIDNQPLSDIRDSSQLSVLLYEDEEKGAEMVERALEDCEIEYFTARNSVAFRNLCTNGKFTHIFISLRHYRECERYLSPAKSRIVLLLDIDETDETEEARDRIIRPVSCMNLGRYFNHLEMQGESEPGEVYFTCPGARVLVIDDNKTNLFVANGLLERYEMNVVTAISGREAVNLLDEKGFDMIFIDYMMPEMDGIDTLKAIRNEEWSWCSGVPCVVLTADAAEGAKKMLLSAGFDEYISKPIREEELADAIRRLIDPELIRKV